MTSAPAMRPASRRRSLLVTLLAWVMMLLGGLGLPISAITVLMFIAGSYGTANANIGEACLIILGPLFLLITGFGLLLRWRWAWYGTLVLLAGMMVHQGWTLMRSQRETETHTTPSGVKVTVMGSGPKGTALPMLAVYGALGAWLLSSRVRMEFLTGLPSGGVRVAVPQDEGRDWRVGHLGRDRMYYEELVEGEWRRLEIEGEMLMGRAHHAIYFASPEIWRSYPEWIRDRRDEIVERVKSAFHAPEYEHHGQGVAAGTIKVMAPLSSPQMFGKKATVHQRVALGLVIMFLAGVAVGMGLLVMHGIEHGQTVMPSKRAQHRRVLKHQDEPASYWAALGLYSLLGLASAAGAGWFVRETWRMRAFREVN